MTATADLAPTPYASAPIPAGRGRWRVTVHARAFAAGVMPRDSVLAELPDARSVRLTQQWCKPATLTFTLDGHSGSAQLVTELTSDVMAWRWDEASGRDVCMFRGVVAQSQDSISADVHTVTFTCHDYLAMIARRYVTAPTPANWTFTQQPQDSIVATFVLNAKLQGTAGNVNLQPGSFLPIDYAFVNPDGTTRGVANVPRDRSYPGQTNMGEAIAQLAACQGGFDFDMLPGGNTASLDVVRVFYPSQGVQRTAPQLVYGATVTSLSRSFNSADYANYQRVVGNSGTATPGAAQLYAEAWNVDASNGAAGAQGLWMAVDNASDVSIQATLNDKVNGALGLSGVVVPSYTVVLRSGVYAYGSPNIGDTVPLIVQSGRLHVDTTIRVLGLDYAVGDDGQEDVGLTLGRADVTLANLFTRTNADVNALARR